MGVGWLHRRVAALKSLYASKFESFEPNAHFLQRKLFFRSDNAAIALFGSLCARNKKICTTPIFVQNYDQKVSAADEINLWEGQFFGKI